MKKLKPPTVHNFQLAGLLVRTAEYPLRCRRGRCCRLGRPEGHRMAMGPCSGFGVFNQIYVPQFGNPVHSPIIPSLSLYQISR